MADVPISLYFGIEEGKHANLETIARASLDWADLIRDIAAVVAPELEFEIEFVQSQEGSVWLSNLLKAVKEGDRKALGVIVVSVLAFFAMGPALHLQTDFGAWLLGQMGHQDKIDLTDDSIRRIAEGVVKAADETNLEERRRSILGHADRDPNVTSVGVDFLPRVEGPITKISRHEFPSYDAFPPHNADIPVNPQDVAYERNIDVSVVRATLREGEKRPRWRFKHGSDEWSATIEDDEFVWALNQDKTGLTLGVGQHMRVDLAVDLKQAEEGIWEPKNRRIIRVRQPQIRRKQGELGLSGD